MNIEWDKNLTEYFNRWKNTLHPQCKGDDVCTCHKRAFDLAISEIACRQRGKPSLPLAIEDTVWKMAFEYHEKHCESKDKPNWRSHVISPDWSKPLPTYMCDCFGIALKMYNAEEEVEITQPVVKILDDFSYERVV